eukprot:1381448-Amphidinium_carterae.1
MWTQQPNDWTMLGKSFLFVVSFSVTWTLVVACWHKFGDAAVVKIVEMGCLKSLPLKGEWNRIVAEAAKRGMMSWIPTDEVFQVNGEPSLNGAMGVRFISILTPVNAFFNQVIDDDPDMLPYLGQLTSLLIEDDEVVLVDSEDLTSSFNLFLMPRVWYRFFGFALQVPGEVFDAALTGTYVNPCLTEVPMGWTAFVGITQSAVRRLVLSACRMHPAAEVRRGIGLLFAPAGMANIYLDSFDWIRALPQAVVSMNAEVESEKHRLFVDACRPRSFDVS